MSNRNTYFESWRLSRILLPMAPYIEVLYKDNFCRVEFFIHIINTCNIKEEHLVAVGRILSFLCLKEGARKPLLKYQNLFIVGGPNTGETSLISKITEVLGNRDRFYFWEDW